ncbi:hypothetical protein H5410_031237 [Solanum commersonii]|uniref:Uncharacterized protein n=1 Tax=Solanum commersonii TaxID=4109 RepID=A0A9J5YGJ8_SOLCO|nr:hypothetical protein H5410_031237 [Solanum commersonii]
MVQQKLKRVKHALRSWSKKTYGDMFQQIATLEDVIQAHEVTFEESPTLHNKEELHKDQAELCKYLHLEEEYWRQKSGLKWFQEREKNTKFFHSYVTEKRKKLKLNKIQNTQGDWLTEERDIAIEAIRYFQEKFTEDQCQKEFSLLNHVPILVTEESIKNNTILFDKKSLKMMIRVLRRYENSSGKLINLEKNAFYVHEKVKHQKTKQHQTWSFPFHILGMSYVIWKK